MRSGRASSSPVERPRHRQRSPRRGPGAAADAVLMGGVHGRGAGEAEGPGPQAPARHPLDVRVGADCGAGKRGRAGRRGALDRKTRGQPSLGYGGAASADYTVDKNGRRFTFGEPKLVSLDEIKFPFIDKDKTNEVWTKENVERIQDFIIWCELGLKSGSIRRGN